MIFSNSRTNSLSLIWPDPTLVRLALGLWRDHFDVQGGLELLDWCLHLGRNHWGCLKVLDDLWMRRRCRISLEVDADGVVEDGFVDSVDDGVV